MSDCFDFKCESGTELENNLFEILSHIKKI